MKGFIPECLIKSRLDPNNNADCHEYLVKWQGLDVSKTSWETGYVLRRLCGGDQLIQIQSKDTACNNSNINNSNDNNNSNEQQHSVDRKADLSSGHNAVLTVSHKAHLTNSRTSSDATPQQTSSRKHLPKTNPMDSAMTQISQPQSQFIVKTRIRTKLTNNDKNNKDINSNNTNNSNNNSNSKTND